MTVVTDAATADVERVDPIQRSMKMVVGREDRRLHQVGPVAPDVLEDRRELRPVGENRGTSS
jgi:hypothetical protein